ncbi:NUDIX domain-containing protein [Nonomuraea sp. NPDC050790]|uniref:NUDIX domain-containing protein n=1 Tax=Nonomuraea sp. NPDC050790 TaxID=3364371 RepID=UPI0037ABABB3
MAAKDGDGWAECSRGHRHWGLHGASGLLAVHHDDQGTPHVLMQKRAWWSHHGGTWGLPGGARDSHEDAIVSALREAQEEAALGADGLHVRGVYLDDHGGWTFETVIAEAGALLAAAPANSESSELLWLPLPEIAARKLHPGFAETWAEVQGVLVPETVVLDVANIVGARAEHGWWKDRLGAATRLVRDVAARSGLTHPLLAQWYPRIVAVVEGAARQTPPAGGVEVVAAEGSGDDTIVELVRQAKPWERYRVVTADRGLKERVSALGAETSGPRWLLSQLS